MKVTNVDLTIFDLDNTLLKTNISFKFYLYLYKKNIFDKRSIFKVIYYFVKFKYFNMQIEKLHKIVFENFMKNKKYSLFTKNVDHFLDKYLDKIFYMPAILELQKAFFNNHYIAIFSSSPAFLVEPISKILKVNEFRATKYLFDKEGKFDKIEKIMDGKKKAKEAKNLMERLQIPKEKVSVYSDSTEDLELFEVAQNKVAVSPSFKLYKLSKKRNWKII